MLDKKRAVVVALSSVLCSVESYSSQSTEFGLLSRLMSDFDREPRIWNCGNQVCLGMKLLLFFK